VGLAVVGEQQGAQRLARLARRAQLRLADLRAGLEQAARAEPVAQSFELVEQVGAVLAVDGVDQRLDEREPPGSRRAAARMDRPAQQGFTLHRISVTSGIVKAVPAS